MYDLYDQTRVHEESQAMALASLNQQLSEAEQRIASLTNDKSGLTRSLSSAQDQLEAASKEASQAATSKRDLENQIKILTTKHEAQLRQTEGEKQKVIAELHQARKSNELEVGELTRKIDQVWGASARCSSHALRRLGRPVLLRCIRG